MGTIREGKGKKDADVQKNPCGNGSVPYYNA